MKKRRELTSRFALVLWVLLGTAGSVNNEASAQTIRRSAQDASSPRNASWQLAQRARTFEPYILQAARRYAIDPRALWAIAFLETRFRPELVSVKGARGMMQFMPGTAARFGLANPHDPIAAIEAAARYVRFLSSRYRDNPALILAAYNAGEGAVDAYLEGITIRLRDGKVINPTGRKTGGVPPYIETLSYVSRGLSVMRQVNDIGIFNQVDLAAYRVPSIVPPTESSTTSLANVPGASADPRETALVPTSVFAKGPTNTEVSAKIVAGNSVREQAKGEAPSSTTLSRLASEISAVQTGTGEVYTARSGAVEPLEAGASASWMTSPSPAAVETARIPTSSRVRRD